MPVRRLALVVSLLFTAPALADEPKPPEGFKSLFNGTDLKGWKVHGGMMDVWGADKGLLYCKTPRELVQRLRPRGAMSKLQEFIPDRPTRVRWQILGLLMAFSFMSVCRRGSLSCVATLPSISTTRQWLPKSSSRASGANQPSRSGESSWVADILMAI